MYTVYDFAKQIKHILSPILFVDCKNGLKILRGAVVLFILLCFCYLLSFSCL